MSSLFQELRRRNVFKVGAVYAVVAFVLAQVADLVLPTFDAPDWVLQSIIFLFVLGFPLAIILTWAFELSLERTLLVAPFDVDVLELTGPAVVLAEDLLALAAGRVSSVGVSHTGRLVYRTGSNAANFGSPV